jgi:glycosyltransferase involved in cell wall biosynthesis
MTSNRVFFGLPQSATKRTRHQSTRICIASYEIAGPDINGGVGTAYLSLARALASAGHSVTVLHLSRDLADTDAPQWRKYFRKIGITFVPLPRRTALIDAPFNLRTSYEAYLWLREHVFDIIHFPELRGHGYYSLIAKHQGHAFADCVICVGTHSPISWIRQLNREFIDDVDELSADYMERECVARADVVISPSQYMLRWMLNDGWQLPAKCYVQQYLMPPHLEHYWSTAIADGKYQHRVEEIVFFGRLEERKGIRVFCDALDHLAETNCIPRRVIFLGKSSRIEGIDAGEYLSQRAKNWRCEYTIIGTLNHEEAIRYLRTGRRLAVIPSLEDNLPHTVMECLLARIPFLTSRTGGIPELIAPEDLEDVTFPVDPTILARRIKLALQGGINLGNPAVEPNVNRREWIEWHEDIVAQARETDGVAICSSRQFDSDPKVSVCLVHHDRPKLLLQAVRSIESQDWPHVELIVVDDGSALPESHRVLDGLEKQFSAKHWRILRTSNRYVGAARNTAARCASGDYLLFMDDDNVAKPNEISTLCVRLSIPVRTCLAVCWISFLANMRRLPKAT